jgi:hypothetical protein
LEIVAGSLCVVTLSGGEVGTFAAAVAYGAGDENADAARRKISLLTASKLSLSYGRS